jgi:3',5'-cyclic AMP phosphodiesterase CpdA
MRTIVHLSDLHFGRVDPALLDPLVAAVAAASPDVVVVSGDLTQRARKAQFAQARAFLDRLPRPRVVVPGNHDIPYYNVLKRFLAPLDNFRALICDDVEPAFIDEEIAVLGVNTARSLTFKHGRINAGQVARIRERLASVPASVTRIVVTHHPFDPPQDADPSERLGRADMAMPALAALGVDVLLSGHLHATHVSNTARRYPIPGFAALAVQAGTATSTRGRGEVNAFNVLRIADPRVDAPRIDVTRHGFDPRQRAYVPMDGHAYTRKGDDWEGVPHEPPPKAVEADPAVKAQAAPQEARIDRAAGKH